MRIAFKELAMRMNTNASLGFKPEVIDYFLNVAYRNIIKERYYPRQGQGLESFEESERRRRDLSALVKYETLVSTGQSHHNNGTLFTLPSDHWWTIEEQCKITYTDSCNDEEVTKQVEEIKPTTHNRLRMSTLIDPFKRPNERRVLRVDTSKTTQEIITMDNATPSEYKIGYIRRPKYLIGNTADYALSLFNVGGGLTQADFVNKTEVLDTLDDEIVNRAVTLVDSRVNPELYQVDRAELDRIVI